MLGDHGLIYTYILLDNNAIKWATENKILIGDNEGNLNLGKDLTRAEAFTLLYRMAGEPPVDKNIAPFSDVTDSSLYYYNAVIWGKNQGIIKGIGDNQFKPNDTCTRAASETYLWRYEGSPTVSGNNDNDPWYEEAAVWALKNKIGSVYILGDYHSLEKNVTRGEAVHMLYRYSKITEERDNWFEFLKNLLTNNK